MSELPGEAALPVAAELEARAAPEADQTDSEAKEEEEAPYDFLESERLRHSQLRWSVPFTLLFAVAGAYCGYVRLPAALRPHPSVVNNLETMGMWLFGIFAITGVVICVSCGLPTRVFGPKPRPAVWTLLLKLVVYWLAMFPFSILSLLLGALGGWVLANGAWVAGPVLLAGSLLFGTAAWMLLIAGGGMRRAGVKPGAEVPESQRKSKWWRWVLALLIFWALLMTAFAVLYGVKGQWSDLTGTGGTALLAWLACLKASQGEVPESEEMFES